jgi:circadian clock protein KaiC
LGWDFQDPAEGRQVALRQVDPARLSPGQFAQMVVSAVTQGAARLVVIDSLNGYDRAMQGGEDLNLQLHELLTYLAQRGVTTILVLSQQGYLDQMRSPVDVTYMADAMVVLRYFEAEGSVRQPSRWPRNAAAAMNAPSASSRLPPRGCASATR